jgi:hypothetical protein
LRGSGCPPVPSLPGLRPLIHLLHYTPIPIRRSMLDLLFHHQPYSRPGTRCARTFLYRGPDRVSMLDLLFHHQPHSGPGTWVRPDLSLTGFSCDRHVPAIPRNQGLKYVRPLFRSEAGECGFFNLDRSLNDHHRGLVGTRVLQQSSILHRPPEAVPCMPLSSPSLIDPCSASSMLGVDTACVGVQW